VVYVTDVSVLCNCSYRQTSISSLLAQAGIAMHAVKVVVVVTTGF
jgi:hypothetical protein